LKLAFKQIVILSSVKAHPKFDFLVSTLPT